MNPVIQKRFEDVAQSRTFRNIKHRFNLDKKSVLDIGCSYGEFLKHFGSGSVGLTVVREEVKVGRSLNLDLRLANIEDENFSLDKTFDAIFANNIFEHMQSPHNFLIKIKKFLKPDGILILGVPCIPYIAPLLYFNKFRGALASLHINFFTRPTLIKSVESAGWEVIETRGFRFSNFFVDYLLNLIYPHFYVIARVNLGFQYPTKRLKELEGYNKQDTK